MQREENNCYYMYDHIIGVQICAKPTFDFVLFTLVTIILAMDEKFA